MCSDGTDILNYKLLKPYIQKKGYIMFLLTFVLMLIIFFALVDPWMKKNKVKPDYVKIRGMSAVLLAIRDLLKF